MVRSSGASEITFGSINIRSLRDCSQQPLKKRPIRPPEKKFVFVAAPAVADAGRRTCRHFAEMAVRVRSETVCHRGLQLADRRTSNQGTHAHPQLAPAATRLRSAS